MIAEISGIKKIGPFFGYPLTLLHTQETMIQTRLSFMFISIFTDSKVVFRNSFKSKISFTSRIKIYIST